MAVKNKKNNPLLHPSTKIEVVSVNEKGDRYKKIMTIDEANDIIKKKGWSYSYYQIGYSAYINALEVN